MKIKKTLAKIWNVLDGNKTKIGAGLHILWFTANAIFKDLSTPTEAAYIHGAIGTLTATGIGHKANKWWNQRKQKLEDDKTK